MRDGRAAENAARRTPEGRARRRALYAARKARRYSDCPLGGPPACRGCPGCRGIVGAMDPPPEPPPEPPPKAPPVHPAKLSHSVRKGLARPFVGVDGEGAGQDGKGRQLYMLLRAGEHELFTGKPLSTRECFRFLTGLPKGPIYVGFSIGYDITMMLRDIPEARIERLLSDKGLGRTSWTFYQGFAISWLPKNHLMIGRTYRTHDGDEHILKGSVRTFYEVFGFFQKSFLKVLHEFDIGTPEQRETIAVNKAARGGFAGEGLTDDMFCPFITETERDYCALECVFLADLMEKFRTLCIGAGIRPRTWNGAGKLSAALHHMYETITAARLAELEPVVCECPHCLIEAPGLTAMATRGYYGGRFETTRHGPVQAPDHCEHGPNLPYLYEYDLRSAYPAEMVKLPCLEHGRWERVSVAQLRKLGPGDLYIAPLRFKHDVSAMGGRPNLCGLPVRRKDGRIFWPMEGNGTYWSTEIHAAARLGCRVSYRGVGWLYRKNCECRPFAWLERLYAYRQSLGGALMGYPIKLGINGTYGKLVQRVGDPKWSNMVWGGLITAGTRARLMEAASQNPSAIVMLATDGLFSREPLDLDLGPGLGQWEMARHARLLIVQPGVYFGASRPKTRGVSPSFFHREDATGEPYTMRFERAWDDFRTTKLQATGAILWPVVTLPVRLFIGTKIALARNRLETAGTWTEGDRHFKFEWTAKRGLSMGWEGVAGWSYPAPGGPDLLTYPHKGVAGMAEEMDLIRAELDDQPDWVDLSPNE